MASKVISNSILKALTLAIAIGVGLSQTGCVYWNTMYNAKKHFKEAEKQNNPELGGTKMTANRRLYEDAIAKAGKVVQKHPKSKYHDDALFLIGVSYFRIDNYAKSESAFRELLAVHPKSEFIEESQLYLARCRMQSGDEQAAYRTFTDLASTARKPEWRAEATFQRGIYLSEIGSHDSAVAAFQQILDEYPDTDRANEARVLAAGELRELKRPAEAMELYTPLTTHKEPMVRYPALIGLGGACYEADLVDSGIAIFDVMAEDEAYVDSIGNIRLLLGDGLERRGDVDAAWRQYEQVAAALERTRWSAEAYFNMAEIKQYQQGDLASAKVFYDKVREEYASGDLSNEALTRSANISKLEQFRKSLGRGELTRGPAGDSNQVYDPEDLPRYERQQKSSPAEARPFDFVHSRIRARRMADSLAALSQNADSGTAPASTTDQLAFGPATPEAFKSIWDDPKRFGPQTPPEFVVYDEAATSPDSETAAIDTSATQADSSALAGVFGPPVDSLELIMNLRASELLSSEAWESILGADSLYGPPSPASAYDFGIGPMFGPETPTEILWVQVEEPAIDSTAILERETRAAMRKEREEAFAEIETAAETQMQLAELYRFDLDYPDSALAEYNDIAERYKGTPYGAQALLAAADIYTSEYDDSTNARTRLLRILAEYPHLDYAGDAIGRLGWRGTDADTAHPMAAYSSAEDRYLLDNDPKGAIKEFRAFIDKYPYSRLVPRAEYAIAALTDRYFPAEDSSVVWAYQEIAATYAQTELAQAATQRLSATVARPKPRAVPVPDKKEAPKPGEPGKTPGSQEEESGYASLPIAPKPKVVGQVEFPSADVGSITKEVVVVYRIVIDYSGAISEYELIQKSPSEDLDEATRRAILETKFDPDSIAPESLNIPYRYEIRVTPPALSPDELDWYNRTGGQPNIPGQP